MALKLYSYYRSSCSWRVRIALNLKKIEYQIVPVNLLKNEQNSGEYSHINPSHLVPSIELKNESGQTIILGQSVAILEFLEERYNNVPLLPKDLIKRAKVREIVQMIASDIQPIQNLRVLNEVEVEKKNEWGSFWINKGFEAIEQVLTQSSGLYCVGDDITMADVLLVPQVYNAERFSVDMNKFPKIKSINERLCRIDAFSIAHPKNQPDCPIEIK
ncbi:Maleylacetoacetate isomerase domain-containing protein [Rozella allomycis CSF55]|uniref:Maleylacetoacetate isomerase domain-containing protein n=1 Tax=Rozella allomycis (strain CSF55) TaxID=988480 RepID=A0A075AY94_ROZAC|nr:Maleylacetoacetate isomerase domain-containing protein [Rozella allomycis CSF55]|eukprot:EPZ35295.1 Maleylacetoacetate isomerase domain-containing protein [Rozella allomycis CSF55]